jgi:nicotinate phosphoribosyltransferase
LTDLYQLTMAFGYWKTGWEEKEAVFHLTFRSNPFRGGFSIACGLASVIETLDRYAFSDEEIDYLGTLTGNDGRPIFQSDFLKYLGRLKLTCEVDAIPEGSLVFPHEPLLRVRGPIIQCQLLETTLLNILNFQSLIATKAARVCLAAAGDPVLEFGLRRAQGSDGGLTASRAAYIGGCAGTSNLLAGKRFGIPVRGTHAHSWVMAFDDELESFEAYARALPNNCVFLVDTYDSLEGVRNAVRVGKQLRQSGHEMVGIRLDSGNLDRLSRDARKILDEAGFAEAVIIASNDLDEYIIASLKKRGATVGVWGVGTRMVTADGQPAMGGVYKLAAVRGSSGDWDYKLKLSEQAVKVSIPGILQVRRFQRAGRFVGDVIHDVRLGPGRRQVLLDSSGVRREQRSPAWETGEDLLLPVWRHGKSVCQAESVDCSRQRAQAQLARLDPDLKRLTRPGRYPVGLESRLHHMRERIVLESNRRGSLDSG